MNVFLVIQDDPFFLAKELPPLLREFKVVGATVLSSRLPKDSFFSYLRRYLLVFGWLGFLKLSLLGLYSKYLQGGNLKRMLTDCKIPLIETSSVNSDEFVEKVKHFSPDVLISIACPQKIGTALLSSVPMAINLHGGYLPDFPGVFTPFWNLLRGAKFGGCTVHIINGQIDGGDILDRVQFEIMPTDSIYSLYRKISTHGMQILLNSLRNIQKKNIKTIKNGYSENSYNSFPTKVDARLFKEKGLKVI